MSKAKFLASVPRKMYWANEVGGTARCPDCGTALEKENHAYAVVTREKGRMQVFCVGPAPGHFCSTCPAVVLKLEDFYDLVALAVGPHGTPEFVVAGIVDLDAVPKEKAHLPFNQDTNPMPLVTFTNFPD